MRRSIHHCAAPRRRVDGDPAAVVVLDLQPRLQTTDLLVLPHGFITDLPHADLIRDRWVLLVSADNPDVGETVTLDQLQTIPWVATYYGRIDMPPGAPPIEQSLPVEGAPVHKVD